jgi:protein-tyrosine phosphatase
VIFSDISGKRMSASVVKANRYDMSYFQEERNVPTAHSEQLRCYPNVLPRSRMTSISSPYEIVEIAHFVNDPLHPGLKGRLTVSMAPGKKDSRWNRDLIDDLAKIKECGVQIIVCLLEWSEMKMLGITDYPKLAKEAGIIFYHVPIRDRGCPLKSEVDALLPLIVNQLLQNRTILIHCSAGLGRAGTVSACCLTRFGLDGKTAINTVRERRPGAIQTEKQEEFVLDYCRKTSSIGNGR